MTDWGQLYHFALKWLYRFQNNEIDYIELAGRRLGDDCERIGFVMDSGEGFIHEYGKAYTDTNTLKRVIEEINDTDLMGSAIYSKWRYFNHWAWEGTEILEFSSREWFVLILERLAEIAKENQFGFQGTLQKIHIESDRLSYGDFPKYDEEMEQQLDINSDGHVCFSAYPSRYYHLNRKEIRKKEFYISELDVEKLFTGMTDYFCVEPSTIFTTDVGTWNMELTNTDGYTYSFSGSLNTEFEYMGTDLSDFIRGLLGLEDLYVFDGNIKPDQLNRIAIDYYRKTTITPKMMAEGIVGECQERLVLDRMSETLEYQQIMVPKGKVSYKYEVDGEVSDLLDYLDADSLFFNVVEESQEVLDSADGFKEYVLTIDYEKNPQRTITGRFDRNGLPDDFEDFAEMVVDFIRLGSIGEMFNPSVYKMARRRKDEYIFCSVVFDEGQKSYYYLTDNDDIVVGDEVIVPVGTANHATIAEVVEINYYTEEEAPIAVEKTKWIVRKKD